MHICFIHTPIPIREVDNRGEFWANFDDRYIASHPNVPSMESIPDVVHLTQHFELPHWIPWLAGVLSASGFDELSAVDLYGDCAVLNGIDESRIERRIRENPADVYLLSPMTVNLPQALRIAEIAKASHPHTKVIFGGVVATPLHEEVARHPSVDYVVRDRGEYALPALLTALRDNTGLDEVKNLSYVKTDGTFMTSKGLYPYIPVDELAFPRVDILPKDIGQGLRYIRQNYALGCPFTCDFCTIQTIGRKPQYFTPDRVLAEVEAYRNHYGDHHHVYFGDETFTVNTARTLEICSALEQAGNITYDAQTRLNCLKDPRLPEVLRNSGCRWLEIGLESVNTSTQDLLKQHTTLEPLEDTLARLRDAGIPTCSYLITGLPNESADDMRRTLDYAAGLISQGLLQATYISNFVPYPGSPMFDYPERFGMQLHHRNFDLYHQDLPPVFDSLRTPSDKAHEVFLEGIGTLAEAMGTPSQLVSAH